MDSRPRSRTSSAPLVPPPSPASALASAPPSPNDGRTRSSGSFWWWVKKGGGTDVEKTHQLRRPLKATEWARRRVSFVLLSVSLAVVGCCLGWRCLYAALSSGSGKGLNGSWRYGRYHDHITGLRPDDAAYRCVCMWMDGATGKKRRHAWLNPVTPSTQPIPSQTIPGTYWRAAAVPRGPPTPPPRRCAAPPLTPRCCRRRCGGRGGGCSWRRTSGTTRASWPTSSGACVRASLFALVLLREQLCVCVCCSFPWKGTMVGSVD